MKYIKILVLTYLGYLFIRFNPSEYDSIIKLYNDLKIVIPILCGVSILEIIERSKKIWHKTN